jgi:hypothetical protein
MGTLKKAVGTKTFEAQECQGQEAASSEPP